MSKVSKRMAEEMATNVRQMLSSQERIRREEQERTERCRARLVQLKDEPCCRPSEPAICEACFRADWPSGPRPEPDPRSNARE